MVGMIGQNGDSTIGLLENQNTHKLMRHGQFTKGNNAVAAGTQVWVKSVRTSDDQR